MEGNCPAFRMGCVCSFFLKKILDNVFQKRPKFRYLRHVEFPESETLIFSSMDGL